LLKLQEIEALLERIRVRSRDDFDRDPLVSLAAERGLQIGAEAILDIGNHILAGHFQESPGENEEIVRRLVARGVISVETGARLAGLGGFRNVLVHGYTRIRPDLVWDALQRSREDFPAFLDDVVGWLAGIETVDRGDRPQGPGPDGDPPVT
jgi:uncharacterized protein YutE (UPF0331/DUF86 family)